MTTAPDERLSVKSLILMPALITLAITILRLVGELQGWSPRFFSRAAGGAGAIVGIVWLVPIFGAWFGLKLADGGEQPPRTMRALGWAAMAFMFCSLAGGGSIALFPKNVLLQLSIFTVASWIAVAIAYLSWPALWRVLLAYGVAARIPVLIVMFLSIFRGWDTHYAKPRPDFPPMGHGGLFFWTALLPQASIWIYVTVVGGLIFGALAAGYRRLATGTGRASALPG